MFVGLATTQLVEAINDYCDNNPAQNRDVMLQSVRQTDVNKWSDMVREVLIDIAARNQ